DGNGWECIARLKDVLPHLRVVLVGGRGEAEGMESARDAGADAWLVQPVHAEQCLATLRWVAVQRAGPGRRTGGACSSVRPVEGALPISPRQQAILQGLAAGLLYKEIAQRLGLSYSAVHKHQHQIFRKLRVNNRSEAIALWLKQVLRRQGD
ncbi:MAG TPA: response regulator transcription factor, partial [Verrucomicrobiae bacterium]|nr:response regulator transcription factor [Verrucomicrobiae bacterium]